MIIGNIYIKFKIKIKARFHLRVNIEFLRCIDSMTCENNPDPNPTKAPGSDIFFSSSIARINACMYG